MEFITMQEAIIDKENRVIFKLATKLSIYGDQL